jgi:hypothetical protein
VQRRLHAGLCCAKAEVAELLAQAAGLGAECGFQCSGLVSSLLCPCRNPACKAILALLDSGLLPTARNTNATITNQIILCNAAVNAYCATTINGVLPATFSDPGCQMFASDIISAANSLNLSPVPIGPVQSCTTNFPPFFTSTNAFGTPCQGCPPVRCVCRLSHACMLM